MLMSKSLMFGEKAVYNKNNNFFIIVTIILLKRILFMSFQTEIYIDREKNYC